MRIYIVACNQYSYLINFWSYLLEKYYPNQDIKILHYDGIHASVKNLPSNYELINLGEQDPYWSNCLIKYFNSSNDTYFILCMEDGLLVDYIDNSKMEIMETEVREGRADKAYLFSLANNEINLDVIDDNIVEVKQNVMGRWGMLPSIWTKEYLLKCLEPNMTIWDFEVCERSKNDGGRVIGLKEYVNTTNAIFKTVNFYDRGQLSGLRMQTEDRKHGFIHQEDLDFIKKMINDNQHQFPEIQHSWRRFRKLRRRNIGNKEVVAF